MPASLLLSNSDFISDAEGFRPLATVLRTGPMLPAHLPEQDSTWPILSGPLFHVRSLQYRSGSGRLGD